MLMHTRGILIMTPGASMVLTGKKALDYSGGVSAEDHQGIGGYEKIMGVNGEASTGPATLGDACRILFRYYEHAYVAPGERFPRRAPTRTRSTATSAASPTRAKSGPASPRWATSSATRRTRAGASPSRSAGDARRGRPGPRAPWSAGRTCARPRVGSGLGRAPRRDSRLPDRDRVPPLTRLGFVPADGPEPGRRARSSRSRRRRWPGRSTPPAAAGRWWCSPTSPASTARPSRCGGSSSSTAPRSAAPWSTSRGPIVFCVISRYHGGAYVVFSRTLNENLQVAALEGSYASRGGALAWARFFLTGRSPTAG